MSSYSTRDKYDAFIRRYPKLKNLNDSSLSFIRPFIQHGDCLFETNRKQWFENVRVSILKRAQLLCHEVNDSSTIQYIHIVDILSLKE